MSISSVADLMLRSRYYVVILAGIVYNIKYQIYHLQISAHPEYSTSLDPEIQSREKVPKLFPHSPSPTPSPNVKLE